MFKLTSKKTSGWIQEFFKEGSGSSKRWVRRNFQTDKQPRGVTPIYIFVYVIMYVCGRIVWLQNSGGGEG